MSARAVTRTVDVLAVGAGPFDLGLAALATSAPELDVLVAEREPAFSWHPGLMFDDALLQVSFLADLVSLVDPTHPLSFLAYLRDRDRLYPFYVRESFHPTRVEYADYLGWCAERLPSVRFGAEVGEITWDGDCFTAEVAGEPVRARHLVLGTGTEPAVPGPLAELDEAHLVHSGAWLHRAADVLAGAQHVAVVGSGQSGAEVVLDLLRRTGSGGPAVSWLTRTAAFTPLDYSKLVLEMTTPGYVEHFHGLPPERRDGLLAEQWRHYKGISAETLDAVHDELYRRELSPGASPVTLRQGVSVRGARSGPGGVVLDLAHADSGEGLEVRADVVVAATGYTPRPFPAGVAELVGARDARGLTVRADHSVDLLDGTRGRVHVNGTELPSHGAAAPDLGYGAVRNATIVNAVAGREVHRLPGRTAYTTFGVRA